MTVTVLLAFDWSSIKTLHVFHYDRASCKRCKEEMTEDELLQN